MSILQNIIFALSVFLVGAGFFTFVAGWISPQVLDRPVMRWLITGKRLAPTQNNRILMASWAILLGGYYLLSIAGYRLLSYVAFLAWLAISIVVFRRTFWSSSEA